MTNPVGSASGSNYVEAKRRQNENKAQNTQENDSLFGNKGLNGANGQDVCELSAKSQPQEKPVSESVVNVVAGKNSKTGEETGLFQIKIFADENQTDPKYKEQCLIYKTDKNEKKYKFKTGQGNVVDFVSKGNDVSVEVSNGNKKLNLNFKKNSDGTYEIIDDEANEFLKNGATELYSKKYKSLDELAVELNQINVPATNETDGDISASKQSQGTGDCSLLSALNALSHSEYGNDVLAKCFVVNEEKNTITVNLPGFGTSFEYSLDMNKQRETNGTELYYFSSGDAEPYYLEKAVSDSLLMVKNGELKLSKDAPSWCKEPRDILSGKPIHKLEPHQVLYALTGLGGGNRTIVNKEKDKDGKTRVSPKDAENAQKILKECEKGETTMVAAILSKKGAAQGSPDAATDKLVKDSFGNEVLIAQGHSYAVKSVDTKSNGDRVVTVIDPYDSSKEIVLNEETFLKTFNVLDSIRIKGNNKHPKYYH